MSEGKRNLKLRDAYSTGGVEGETKEYGDNSAPDAKPILGEGSGYTKIPSPFFIEERLHEMSQPRAVMAIADKGITHRHELAYQCEQNRCT